MADFGDFRTSLLSQLSGVAQIEEQVRKMSRAGSVSLAQISDEEVPALTRNFWQILSNLNLGRGATRIVIGSKAMHHLFPELLPPIDRRYTLRFFLRYTALVAAREKDAFEAIFERFHRIAVKCAAVIDRLLKEEPSDNVRMRTSTAKIIDNAIVGYGIDRLRVRPKDD